MNSRCFDGVFERHFRHERGDSFSEHSFTRAWRPDENHIVPARDGDFRRALSVFLPFYVFKINFVKMILIKNFVAVKQKRLELGRRFYQLNHLSEIADRKDVDARHEPGFYRVFPRDYEFREAGVARGNSN